MPQAVSLAELRSGAYLYADERPGGTDSVLEPTEVDRIINGVLSELWELFVSAREDDGQTKSKAGATVANQASYALPDDFFQRRALELNWSSQDIEEVPQIQLEERNHYTMNNTWGRGSPKGFRMLLVSGARKLVFYPTPTSVVTYTLFYIPTAPLLMNPGETFDVVNGGGKLVSLGAAIEMRSIVQNEASDLKQMYAEQYARIERMARDREATQPIRIRDVHPEEQTRPWYWRRRPTV